MGTKHSGFMLRGGSVWSVLFAMLCTTGCAKPGASRDAKSPDAAEEAGGGKGGKKAGGKKSKDGAAQTSGESADDDAVEPDEGQGSASASGGGEESSSQTRKKAPRPKMSKKAKGAFKNGQKAFAAGDLRGAKTQFEQAIKADKDAYEAHLALGVVFERLGKNAAARKSYQKAYQVVPDHEESISAHAVLTAREGRADEAMRFLKKKSVEVGKTAAILSAMAEVASLQGKSGDAQEFAQEALKVDPSHKPAMVALARDHYRARRIDLALYALTGILDGYGEDNPPRDKNNAEARMMRGLIYAERGLRGPAMEEMEKAIEQRPDLVDAHLVLANYMMEAGNAKDARKHLEMAIRYDNKNVAAHLQLGDAYRLLNRNEDAKRELEWVLAADPNQGAAHYNLGLLYLLGGKIKGMSEAATIDKALEHFEAYKARAVRGGPDDVDDLITRARTKKALLNAKQQGAGG